MSYVGEQLRAPEGFRNLEKGKDYFYLGRFGKNAQVKLIHFDSKPGAYLSTLDGKTFEDGIAANLIEFPPKTGSLPPWLARLEGIDLTKLDKGVRNLKKSYGERVDKRFEQIRPLLAREKEMLSAEDPEAEIAKFARNSTPKLHPDRIKLWFFTYLAFGRSKWALLPPFCNNGQWDRVKKFPGKKFGCPSLSKGKYSGSGMVEEDNKLMEEGYLKFRGLGVFMTKIYAITVTEKFGCKVRTVAGEEKDFYHPQGKPFPTYWQFRRRVVEKFGLSEIQLALYGAVRMRTKKSASKGKFSECVANLVERLEADAYYLKEVPKGLTDGLPMPPLCVVRLICVTSAMIVGIGFAIGKERADAYRMALFSMAVPKDEFCDMFGLKIDRNIWPCEGMPSWGTFDRGPGAAADLIKDFEHRIPIRELAPSWSGQSKATIESSHPRDVKIEGKPTYIQSDKTYVDLARREIERTIRDNQRHDVLSRMTPSMIKAEVFPTPLGIWNYLSCRRRTNAHPIPFDVAVRNLLVPIEFTAHEDGVYLHEQRFDSDVLRETKIHDKVVAGGVVKLSGFALVLSLRHAWVDIQGKIVRIDPKLAIRDHEGQLYLSLFELLQLSDIRAKLRSRLSTHRLAVDAEALQRFQEGTGKDWDAGIRKPGRPKRSTVAARQEFADVQDFTSDKRRAS